MKSVSAALTWRSVSARCVESTFETKKNFMLRFVYGVSAMFAITGPRSLPPMPMLTTFLMRRPAKPFHLPWRTWSEKSPIWSSTLRTSFRTSFPSTFTLSALLRLRSAVWRTARPSVALIFLPVNIFSISSLRFDSFASFTSAFMTFSSTRFLE